MDEATYVYEGRAPVIHTRGTVMISRQLILAAGADRRDDRELYDALLSTCERQAAAEGRPLVKL